MKCKCGHTIPDKSKFCPECGTAAPKPEPVIEIKSNPIPPIMTIQQVADFLNVSKPTIYQLMHKDKLPWVPVGQCKRFITDEVISWAKKRQQAG